MSPAERNLHDVARSFTELPAKVARAEAGGTFLPATVAKAAPAQVVVTECGYCDGLGYCEDGGRCWYCGGKGRVASEGGEA